MLTRKNTEMLWLNAETLSKAKAHIRSRISTQYFRRFMK